MRVPLANVREVAVEVGEGAVQATLQVAPALAVVDNTVLVHVKLAPPVVGAVVSDHVWEEPLEMVTEEASPGPLHALPPALQLRVVPAGMVHLVLTHVSPVITQEPEAV